MNKVSLIVLVSLCLWHVQCTPLDDYVNAPDPTYTWKLNSTIYDVGFTVYVLHLTSQTWMTSKQSNTPVWTHWLNIAVPTIIDKTKDTACLFINGGSNTNQPPTEIFELASLLAISSGTVAAELQQVPNEPIIFENDGVKRTEDEIIAYTWAHFINDTKDPTWLLRLPMTKAAVKAMDAIQEFTKKLDGVPTINNFFVSGASKRGWTTWTTAAVDKRVIAIAPLVIPVLNIVPNINHQWRAYGQWSFALDDYLKMGNMKYLNDPVFLELAAIVDPFSYLSRLTMPKLIVCATGDEFFLPDSPSFFYDQLLGEKHLRMVPNAEHSLGLHVIQITEEVETFYHMVISNHPRPNVTWELERSNTTAKITVYSDTEPTSASTYYANTLSDTMRDFRMIKCADIENCVQPIFWWSLPVHKKGQWIYEATMKAPEKGWTGFLIELEFRYSFNPFAGEQVFRVTSEVNVVPDTLPFPPCGQHCQ